MVLIMDPFRIVLGYVVIYTDASTRNSIKRKPKCALISCGSSYISSAELIYAMMELELFAL